MGQAAMAEESNIGFMMMMGRSILDRGKIQPLDEIFSKVRATTAGDLQDMAIEVFDERKLSYLRMEPK